MDTPGKHEEELHEDEPLTVSGVWAVTPFIRLARVHAGNSAADAMIAVALAGSLFFSIDPDAARWRVLLYLLLTIAPFAIVGPFIGPAIDKAPGGRRATVIAIMGLRAVAAALMIPYIDSLLLFPVAFVNLVLGKSYAIAKASIVPTTVVEQSELVGKNSRLAVLTGVAGFVGAAPALAAQALFSSKIALGFAAFSYLVAFVLAFKLPSASETAAAWREEREESFEPGATPAASAGVTAGVTAGITLSGSAMAVMRGVVGFMTFMIAFGFRGGTDELDLSGMGSAVGAGIRDALGFAVDDGSVPAWKLGIILACSAAGSLAGSILAPRLRERTHEENLLLGGLAAMTLVGLLAVWTGGLQGAGILALVVGFSASAAKVAFDAIVQRDAREADYGAFFARFETRFQIAWVIGALVPVVLRIPPRLGYFILALAAALAGASFLIGMRTLADGGGNRPTGRSAGTRGGLRRPPRAAREVAQGIEHPEPLAEPEPPVWLDSSAPNPPQPTSAPPPSQPSRQEPATPPMWDDHR